jgi:hypothetical protein
MDSTVAFDESGGAHVEIHDQGTTTVGGDEYDYSTDLSGDVALDGDLESDVDLGSDDDDGGLFDTIGGLFS